MTPSWRHDTCSSLLGTREKFTCWTRVSYLWLKKKGGERGKRASPLGWNMDMQAAFHQKNLWCFMGFRPGPGLFVWKSRCANQNVQLCKKFQACSRLDMPGLDLCVPVCGTLHEEPYIFTLQLKLTRTDFNESGAHVSALGPSPT